MPRQPTGQIVERTASDGRVWRSLRFRAGGQRHTEPLGAVSRAEAEAALRHRLADVERGQWSPPEQVQVPVDKSVPTFQEFADDWWLRQEGRLSPRTAEDYRWRLQRHLLPYFGELPVDAITFDTVERYIAEKLADAKRVREAETKGEPMMEDIEDRRGRVFRRKVKPLSARAINMITTLLAAILEGAVERELLARNPAKGKGRRIKERSPTRSSLETADQVRALLDAAGVLDREADDAHRHVERQAIIATLLFAGLRVGELCGLRWRDVDLASGWLTIGEAKTDAGRRRVKIRGALRDELGAVRSRAGEPLDLDGYVFPTRTGGRQDTHNVRARVVNAAVGRANADLERRGLVPLPTGLTPHSLRRTFCSIMYGLGEDPGTVMDEMGHTDPALALRIYRQAMRRDDREKEELATLVDGATAVSPPTGSPRGSAASLISRVPA